MLLLEDYCIQGVRKKVVLGFRLGVATWLSSREYSRIAFFGIDQVCNFEV
jgi:hypothetical protein